MAVERLLLESGDSLFLETGDDLLLESSTGGTAYTLACDAGSFSISGQAANLVWSGANRLTGGGWAEWAKTEKRRRVKAEKPAEEVMQEALEPVVSAPRKTITMASLIGKKAAAELAPFDSSAAAAISRRRKRQRDDELLLLM